ncbi:MAG: nucleoside-diphosphate kinase [Candidatus Andersenbacteria bacterium]
MPKKPAASAPSVHDLPELQERTLMLVKPDGVMRGIVGKVLSRVEESGLKMVGLKLVKITRDFADRHQPSNEDWIKNLGNNTLKSYKENGRDPIKELGTDDPLKIGKMIREWNTDFLTSAPVVAVVWQGNHAVTQVRKIIGSTLPIFALPGTIRGDFSKDSPALSAAMRRAVRNVVHASGNLEEATYEIDLWFDPDDLYDYQRLDWEAMFGQLKS